MTSQTAVSAMSALFYLNDMTDSLLNNVVKAPVAAVIVVYNDYHALVDLVLSLSSQVESIVIIDNSDDAGEMPETVLELPAVVYRRQPTNEGLGAGLNTGITVAIEGGVQWVLLLDQDSTVSDNMVDSMLSSYRKCSDASAVAMLCLDVFLQEKGRHQHPLSFASFPPAKVTATSDVVDFCITSGCMVKSTVFDDIGLMQAAFFIDYIDYDFCLRLRSRGYKILFVKDATLLHELGEMRTSSMGLRHTFHSPLRVFYQTRNRLIVVRRYGLRFPSFAVMQLFLFVLKFFKILTIEDQKVNRLKQYFRGIWKAFTM